MSLKSNVGRAQELPLDVKHVSLLALELVRVVKESKTPQYVRFIENWASAFYYRAASDG